MSQKTVDTSVICTWLGIPPAQWPPDHYTLLGLTPAEPDMDRIERQVQHRLEQVRRYQLTNPEPATEAMNRIAQAFVCLTDPQARRAYDRSLFGEGTPAASGTVSPSTPTPLPAVLEPAPAGQSGEIDPDFLSLVEEGARTSETTQSRSAATASSAAALPSQEDAPDPTLEAARGKRARRGLGTRRALYERLVRVRALLRLWERAGRYLAQTKKRLSRPSEARELIEVLTAIRKELQGFPALIGEAGQSGYLVLALARQQAIVPTFQTLLPSQREALARDWAAGQKVLREHQSYLREESWSLRHKSVISRLLRALRSFLNEHPAGWLIVLGVVALAVALLRRSFL